MTQVTGAWRTNPATQKVCAALTDAGARALFVGGCVRNALLSAPVADIDIATDAKPERVMELAEAAALKAIPTGIEHGTVTVVSSGIPHEITTFRRDISTDGRRARVSFSTDVAEDASRRDFTMNALYAEPDGKLVDPLGGVGDLRARRVRFIGSAQVRIREDYLRALRYFRFHAWYGDPENGLDADALAAIAANLDGFDIVSRERIGAEMLKLLAAPDPAPSIAGMRGIGMLARVFPGADDRALAPLVEIEADAGLRPDPLRRLAALGGAKHLASLRLSKAQVETAQSLAEAAKNGGEPGEIGYRHKERAADILALRAAFLETRLAESDLRAAQSGAAAQFPVSARDLMPELTGPALGKRLDELEARWIATGFSLTRAELLAL